ncbi:MAG: hypothetical protein WD184_05660 [Acidimicrobiia bacterium]
MTKRLKLFAAMIALTLVAVAAPAMAAHTEEMMVGDAITEAFELDDAVVHDLHEAGIGYGAIFLLQMYAYATGMTVEELLAEMEIDPETGEYAFNFGELQQSLTEEQLALLEDLPKNLGQIVSAANRPEVAVEGEPEVTVEGEPEWAGEGQPPWAGEGRPTWAGEGKPPFVGNDDDDDDLGGGDA